MLELHYLPAPTPPVVSPSRQFGLELFVRALLGSLVGESCHFHGWPAVARCWEWTQDRGQYCRNSGSWGGVGRALVAAVDWVTGRRAGVPDLLTGGEAPGVSQRQYHRAPATGAQAAQRARLHGSIGGWVCILARGGGGATFATRVSCLLCVSVCARLCALGMAGRYLRGWQSCCYLS